MGYASLRGSDTALAIGPKIGVGRSIQKYPAATRRELLRRLAALAVRSRVSEWTLDGILGFLGFASARSVTADDAIAVLLWSKREDRD